MVSASVAELREVGPGLVELGAVEATVEGGRGPAAEIPPSRGAHEVDELASGHAPGVDEVAPAVLATGREVPREQAEVALHHRRLATALRPQWQEPVPEPGG